jgi:hypothetical protein
MAQSYYPNEDTYLNIARDPFMIDLMKKREV